MTHQKVYRHLQGGLEELNVLILEVHRYQVMLVGSNSFDQSGLAE